MRRRHRLLWLITLTAVVAGGLLCLLTGRTAAHALVIALAAAFVSCTVHATDACLPLGQSRHVRRLSALIFALAGLALLGFYAWHIGAEETIFINDDALWHYQQLELSDRLNAGLPATLAHFRKSLSTDYACLQNLLLAPLFSLTDRTADGFGLASALMAWPLLMYQLRLVTLHLSELLRLSARRTLLLCAGVCLGVLSLPLLHRAALWRQANLLGLPLAVLVLLLTRRISARPDGRLQWAALLAICVLLSLMRRWFLFFLAGWLPLWGCLEIAGFLLRRQWQPMGRFLLRCALCAAVGALLLWPVLSRALAGNYAVAYAYWRKDAGGLAYEISNQGWLLGWGSCVLIAAGYLWGLLQRRSREVRVLSALLPGCAAIGVLLFTRIQNMTFHQVTFLMPAYALGLMLFFCMLAALPRGIAPTALTGLACAALLLQGALSVTSAKPQQLSPLLSHVSLQPPLREDRAAIADVSRFIADACTPEHPTLILMNSSDYDRLTFVTHAYPDLTLRQKVALDRTALVSDGFPRMWFAARYILVPTVPQTNQPGGTVEKLTHWLLEDAADRFDQVAAFPMEGFELLVMERREPVQYEEYEELLALFSAEHALYPAVYGDRMGYFYGVEAGWQQP